LPSGWLAALWLLDLWALASGVLSDDTKSARRVDDDDALPQWYDNAV
jgi:hypothetical protein